MEGLKNAGRDRLTSGKTGCKSAPQRSNHWKREAYVLTTAKKILLAKPSLKRPTTWQFLACYKIQHALTVRPVFIVSHAMISQVDPDTLAPREHTRKTNPTRFPKPNRQTTSSTTTRTQAFFVSAPAFRLETKCIFRSENLDRKLVTKMGPPNGREIATVFRASQPKPEQRDPITRFQNTDHFSVSISGPRKPRKIRVGHTEQSQREIN